jgi:ABC-2 type transport system permease protein
MFLTLVKTSLNLNFGISALKYRFTKEKRKRWEPIVIGISIIAGGLPIIALYCLMLYGIYSFGVMVNQPEIVLTVSFVFGQVIILIFGIFYIMSTFYFSRDLSILIPLPLRPYQVLGSKFIVIMANELLTALPILLPAVIIYGAGTGQGFLYWLKSIFVILTSPAIPLIIDSLFVMLLMRFVNLRKSKDLLAIVGGIFGIVLSLGVNLFIQRIPWESEQGTIENYLLGNKGLIEIIGRAFPPSLWATYGLARPALEGLGYFILFVGFSIVLFAFLLWLSNLIFYKSVLAGQEATRKRKKLSTIRLNREYGQVSSPVSAIFRKEWRLLMRTPVYVLNGLVGAVIGPIIIVFMLLAQGQDGEARIIFEQIQKPEMALYVTLGGLGFMLFTAGMSVVAPTSLSREGQTFWISKIIPVSPGNQVTAKLLLSVSISFIGILITGVIFAVYFKFSIVRVLIMLVLGLLGSVPLAALGLLFDVLRPKLEWTNPQEAVKQNLNAIFGILASILVIGVLAIAAVILVLLGIPEWVVYLVIAVVIGVLTVPSLMGLYAAADSRYRKLEV